MEHLRLNRIIRIWTRDSVSKIVVSRIISIIVLGFACLTMGQALAANGFGVAGNNQQSNQQNSPAATATATTQPAPLTSQQTAEANLRHQTHQESTGHSSIGSDTVTQEAFSHTIQNLMPLSPDQIRALRYLFDQSQQAASTYPGSLPPKPTSSAIIVNLSPGATPPVVRLRSGYVTSLVFLDSTGEPWPIAAFDLGNPKSFNIQWDQKSNTLMVQALDTYQTGNLAVMLKGQNTPVMVTLLPGQGQVDYRVDLRVPGLGPNASPTMSDLPGVENPKLLDFLNGTPPSGSKLVQVTGGPSQAWVSGGRLYIRTRLTVLSPSWLATMSSPDGTHVYELMKSPVVLASSRGKIIQLKIEGL